MSSGPGQQRGATLVVALLMLTVLAILAVNAVNESTVDLHIVANLQGRGDALAAVQDAIEQTLSDKNNFTHPTARTIRITRSDYGDYVDVSVAAPVCRQAIASEGYSATAGSPTEDTVWEVTDSVTDPATGARAEVHQGIAMVMRLGSCPAP